MSWEVKTRWRTFTKLMVVMGRVSLFRLYRKDEESMNSAHRAGKRVIWGFYVSLFASREREWWWLHFVDFFFTIKKKNPHVSKWRRNCWRIVPAFIPRAILAEFVSSNSPAVFLVYMCECNSSFDTVDNKCVVSCHRVETSTHRHRTQGGINPFVQMGSLLVMWNLPKNPWGYDECGRPVLLVNVTRQC